VLTVIKVTYSRHGYFGNVNDACITYTIFSILSDYSFVDTNSFKRR